MNVAPPENSATSVNYAAQFPSVGACASVPLTETYRARDGALLPFRRYGGNSQTALVLLHGSAGDGAYLATFAQALSRENVASVYTPDLRGHGLSPKRRGDIDYIEQLEDDLADFIDHIRATTACSKLVVGGHSGGGGLALRFGGGRHGNLAHGYLLLAPYLGHNAPTVKRRSGGWVVPSLRWIVAIAILNSLGFKALNHVKVLRFNLHGKLRTGTETPAYSFRMMMGLNPINYRTELRAMKAPALVLVGSEDEAFLATEFEDAIHKHKPDAELKVVDGATHAGLVESAEAIAETSRWIARHGV